MNKTLNAIVRGLILLGMLIGLGMLILIALNKLPGGGTAYVWLNGSPAWMGAVSAALAALAVLCGEYIAYKLWRMMRSLEEDPFVRGNVRALRAMGIAALLMGALGLLTLCFRPVPLLVVGALPICMCGLFSLVLSGVFARAVAYKEETDLTV